MSIRTTTKVKNHFLGVCFADSLNADMQKDIYCWAYCGLNGSERLTGLPESVYGNKSLIIRYCLFVSGKIDIVSQVTSLKIFLASDIRSSMRSFGLKPNVNNTF